ncbi:MULTISPECIES: FlgO family outer membrane protein [unclassified Pseudoalteromonas]|uniref:FlgO family outer membrane protein n=1 Tax=unclassified Pseudoalteromonas TaxID=194690 RepID=UPI0025B46F79|nr:MULTISPECIES: FlgO family outer membrane protein [unclassified Pseudoalteromonas]MDN3379314.1 FlgO family outer membrane protein [Pseudoalteromonas sp. APC 3893]MDN3386488.1 FlgO family outer membrane protein [Pseudoalteromonas sp. APC 4017]
MKRLLLTLCLPLGFGCSQMMDDNSTVVEDNSPQLAKQRTVAEPGQTSSLYQNTAVMNDSSQITPPTRKNINHYVRGIMQDMAENLQYVNTKTPLAVSSFIYLDDEYNDGTLLGNQLAESFMHELHSFGVPVIDFKATDYMRVTPSGDFVFSRDYLELSQEQNFNYVLAGTMVNHQGGVLVNARIVGLTSKAVVGSAQGFIPQSVVDALDSSYRTDGVMLKQANE